jgi:isoamylase
MTTESRVRRTNDVRIDAYPQLTHGEYRLRAGRPLPFGATLVPGGVNFSIYSREARRLTLVLFEKGAAAPIAEIPFSDAFRIGDVFAMVVFDLDPERIEYGFRAEGPFEPAGGRRFNRDAILLDPYARAVSGRDVWGKTPDWNGAFQHRACLVPEDFDWEDDRALEIPFQDLVVYEAHLRGFTRHPSSGAKHPGTFAALREKVPYLKALGVNCIELMPIYEFDEFENSRTNPHTGELLLNYWGYSTVSFFAPKSGYAATGAYGMQVDELKTLIKDLHKHGIEVILDVVYNHTAEGNEHGPTISYRGLDNRTYYMLTPDGYYQNFSGCGNTLNCNNPVVRAMVVDSLRYWASEFHIDGFRFDLASILGRDPWGAPMANPPLIEQLALDPVLSKCKLVAEAWDAGGLYQVGNFPGFGRWAEWNGKYRDTIRKYLKGDSGQLGDLAQRIQGSPDLYRGHGLGTTASINFITCHDGFTLRDLVSYDGKHNEANGEGNRDGNDDNVSWNCGVEGETSDPHVNALRLRQMKNAMAILLMSQGIPMILMGDEVGRTQRGNNNTYCHDNELSWFDWGLLDRNEELLRFVSSTIAFRRRHHALRRASHFVGDEISWHGVRAWNADWSSESRAIAFLLDGEKAEQKDASIYVAMNMHWEALWFELPRPSSGQWHVFANTGAASPGDVFDPGAEPLLPDQGGLLLGSRSVVILVTR